MLSPEGDAALVVDHPEGVGVEVSEEEEADDVGESAEEAELERGEEGGVDGPQEHHVRPDPVPSAVITSKPN